ncbi:MAG: ribose 5-phosphate isomerase A [Candidatus Thorarchaeota archaeon]|nr:ribose 5-phosphate isomerase A [Candidatus Thorarchaeota archaeon]
MAEAKVNAALGVLKELPRSGPIGLGSGSTVAIFAKELGRLVASGEVAVSVVPSSYQAYQLAVAHRIPLANLDENPELLMTVDGADEIDRALNLTKGGGGALLREKIVAAASRRLVIVADESKLVDRLGSRFLIPIEVLPFSLGFVRRRVEAMGMTPILREAQGKLGPVVTDNGNFLLDLKFPNPIDNPAEVAEALKMIPGVIETGLFVGMAERVYVGTSEGCRVLTIHS